MLTVLRHAARDDPGSRRVVASLPAAPKSAGLFESVGGQRIDRGSPQIQKDHRESQKAGRGFSGPEISGPL